MSRVTAPGTGVARPGALLRAAIERVLGDGHGRNTLEYQPTKLAAMEAIWDTGHDLPWMVFAWPDMGAERNDYALDIRRVGSLILTHSLNGEVQGLKAVPPEDRPYVPLPFFAFRIMVAIWEILMAIALLGLWLRWRKRLYDTRWFAFLCAFSSPLPFIAVLAGWTVTETGRQPWIVYGQLRTAEAAAPLAPGAVSSSLVLFLIVYLVLLVAFFWYECDSATKQSPSGIRAMLAEDCFASRAMTLKVRRRATSEDAALSSPPADQLATGIGCAVTVTRPLCA